MAAGMTDAEQLQGAVMKRTFAAVIFSLLTVTAPAHAAIIPWDFFEVGDNPVIIGPTVNDTATVSVAGYFDYDTTTFSLASLPNPFHWQLYENGTLRFDCCSVHAPGEIDLAVDSGIGIDGPLA